MKLQVHQQPAAPVDAEQVAREVWNRIAREIKEDSRTQAEEYLRSTEVPHGGE